MARHRQRLQSSLLTYLPVLLLALALTCLPELLHFAAARSDPAKYRELLAQADDVFGLAYRAGPALLLMAGIAVWRSGVSRSGGLAAVALVQALVVAIVVVPVAGVWQQGRVQGAADVARNRSETIVTWGANQPSFAVYRGAVTPVRDPQPGEIVLTHADRLAQWPGAEILYQSAGLVLAKLPAADER